MATKRTRATQTQQAPAETATTAAALDAVAAAPPEADAAIPTAPAPAQTEDAPPRRGQPPELEPRIPMVGAAIAAATSLWRQLVEGQLAGFEATVGRLEQLGQRQLERAQVRVDEASRLAQGGLRWLAEQNAENARRALELARSAASLLPRRAA